MHRKESASTKHLVRPFELKELKEDGTFSGYGSVFGVVDRGLDVVNPGCFTRTLAEAKAKDDMPKMLWQHRSDEPIGAYTAMSEDAYGLKVEGALCMETQRGREAYALLKMKAIKGLSIGYVTQKAIWDSKTDIRTLLDVDLYEVSLVTFAMNPDAQVSGVKGNTLTEREFERLLTRDAGFSRSEALVIINQGFKSLKTTRDAGLGLNDLLSDLKATNQQLANLSK